MQELAVPEPLASRSAGADDIDAVTRTIALAFADDPVWGPAMGGAGTTVAQKAAIWRLFVAGPIRYPWSSVVGDGAAVSIWLPPGGTELDDAGHAALADLLASTLGANAAREFHALAERFEANHTVDVPHAYLSLLATHPDQRGRGIGMALLADDLRRLDALHLPAWLESTNPGNDRRYESVGFEPVGSFRTIDDRRVITTMWRPAR
jgi:GNAT superfamily N-acetyltransferase